MVNHILNAIHRRRSIGNLSLPMPNDDELQMILEAAIVAPDHKQLKPWQFWVLTGDALNDFGQVLLSAAQSEATACGEVLDEVAIKKTVNMPLRAPMIIAVATKIKQHKKVPPFEQLLSTGAAIENMLLALESLGYHSVWRSGSLCNTTQVKTYFGVSDDDTVCGLIYIGTSTVQMPERESVNLAQFVQYRQ